MERPIILDNGCDSCPVTVIECRDNGHCKGGKITFGCNECKKEANTHISLIFPRETKTDGDFSREDFCFFCSKHCKKIYSMKHRLEIRKTRIPNIRGLKVKINKLKKEISDLNNI